MKTQPLILPLVSHPDVRRLLYPHQAVMLDEWNQHDSFLLITKTGTGKTIGAMLPVLKNRLKSIAVYPTNELIRDQVRNIKGIAESEGLHVCIFTPETMAQFSASDVILVHVDGPTLDVWQKHWHLRSHGKALSRLLTEAAESPGKATIVLTNPDVLFLLFALRYHPTALAALTGSGYETLILDEFHLYTGVELAHALMMAHFGKHLGVFRKVLLLSATPDPEVRTLLDRLLRPRTIEATVATIHSVEGERMAVHAVDVVPVLSGQDVVETAFEQIRRLYKSIRDLRIEHSEVDYLPAVVVLNSVVNAIRLEDRLVEENLFKREELAIIRGLSSREVRQTEGKLLAIGTSAIEVGIDFKCDMLIFEAGEAASFMQRFGRVGRHKPGTAYVLCPSNVLMGIETLPPEVDRAALEERVYAWYQNQPVYAFFITTFGGLLTTYSLAYSVVNRVRQDFEATPEQVALARERMDELWNTYADTIGTEASLIAKVRAQFRKMEEGASRYRWIRAYTELNTFRTSLPSQWVHDFKEQERRGDWKLADYTTDIAALLRRAEGLRFNEKIWNSHEGRKGILTVKGYGKYKQVWLMPTFSDEEEYPCGEFHVTRDHPNLMFYQEGHRTSVSHAMTLRDHIFVLLPEEVARRADWRLPVFECGKRFVAFDGAALLLNEIRQHDGQ